MNNQKTRISKKLNTKTDKTLSYHNKESIDIEKPEQ